MKTIRKVYQGTPMMCRPGTSDSFIMREVLSGEYRKLNILPTDTIADIGLNIGTFSIWAVKNGARRIHAYEPDKDNFDLANRNLRLNKFDKYVTTNNLAVTGTEDPVREFSINDHKNKGLHSLLPIRGRDTIKVNCISINKIIEEVKPTLMKLDIEGAEYECLLSVEDFGSVQEIIMEFHHAQLNDMKTREKYRKLVGHLRDHFSTIDTRQPSVIGGAWTGMIHCFNYG